MPWCRWTLSPPERSRAYTWGDPAATAAALGERSGLDAMRALAAGAVAPPPMWATLGFEGLEVGEGWSALSVTPAEWQCNTAAAVHGGVAAALLDSVLGNAIHTVLPAGTTYTTASLEVKLTRPVLPGTGRLRAEARAVHVGRRTATAEGWVADPDGRVVAHGTTTCLILPSP